MARQRVTVGFRAHTGWAAGVALSDAGTAGVVVTGRRRIDLHESTMPLEMYHVASSRQVAEAEALIRNCAKGARAMAKREIGAMIAKLEAEGHRVAGAGVVMGSGRLLLPLEAALRSHAGCHAAEGELYRQAVLHACESLGLRVTAVAEPELFDFGAAALETSAEKLRTQVARLGDGLGPPWRQDQKSAALVAWLAMRAIRTRRR